MGERGTMINSQSDRDLESECDARTLAEAEVIKKDATRHERAQAAATRLAEEKKKEADAMAKIADGKGWYEAITPKKKQG